MDTDPQSAAELPYGVGGDRRVAVTGLGLVSGFGIGVKPFWESLSAGRSALRPLGTVPGSVGELFVTRVDDDALAAATAGEPVERTTAMLGVAVAEALADSGLATPIADGARHGLGIGTCQGMFHADGAELPLRADRHVVDMYTRPADEVARRFGLRGPQAVISTACASSTTALAWSAAQIRDGRAEVMVSGGAESLCLFALAGFHGLRATSPNRCAPYTVSDGMSIGEGAAVLILEEWEHAVRRGATILAEFLGSGMSADAYHPVAPDPTARGALAAARRALAAGGLGPERVDYVSGHGTGTANNDAMEKEAMILLFGDRVGSVPISSVKSAVGHTLGAAGAIEAVASVLALRDGVLPPTAGAGGALDDRIDIVPDLARSARVEVVLSNSYAFGGNNASILLASPTGVRTRPRLRSARERAVLTGVGAVGPTGTGHAALLAALAGGAPAPARSTASAEAAEAANPEPVRPEQVLPALWRRMDDYTRRAALAAWEALREAGIDPRTDDGPAEEAALMFATAGGPMRSVEEFGRSLSELLVPERRSSFARTTMTSAPGTLGICLGLRGPTITFLSGGTAGLQALDHACALVSRGDVPYAVVVACDEITDAVLDAQTRWWGSGRWADGAVAVVVESAARARARGRRALAVVEGTGQAGGADFRAGRVADPAAFTAAATRALAAAGRGPREIDWVLAAGADRDRAEAQAELHALAGLFPDSTPIGHTRRRVGETMAAGGLVDAVAAIAAMRGDLRLPADGARFSAGVDSTPVGRVLIGTVGCGAVIATVLGAPDGGAGVVPR
ncbi:beta-ketoacyl synthase N-terminal-like domain-containing protein [Embleya sp. NPDC020886]|uniref:beta-ketoacyl synthase N-terminal-like domain-containing protein n=1 Tax=Embleya sp. NPDC020886 TaxID=3363980 RepID=UPI0037A93EF1